MDLRKIRRRFQTKAGTSSKKPNAKSGVIAHTETTPPEVVSAARVLAELASVTAGIAQSPALNSSARGSSLKQLGDFSSQLLQLRDFEAIRNLFANTVVSILGVESVQVIFDAEATNLESLSPAREGGVVLTARGVSGALAMIHVGDKMDWSPMSSDDASVLETMVVQLGLRLENLYLERKLIRQQESSIQALAAAIEVKDRYTSGHTKRVGTYADAIARELPMSELEREKIRLAGVLHDIGKIGVPDRILLKPSSLTEVERDEMRRHTEAGFDIVSRVAGLEEIAEILRHHHERWDGKGYPRGLKGDAIPFSSRVISVADTFDAIVTDRPYRPALSPQEARAIIVELAGIQFDPQVVQAFDAAFARIEMSVLVPTTS